MDVKVQRGSIEATQADAIIVNLFEGVEVPAGATGAVDKALNGAITDVIRSGDYRGKLNEFSVLYARGAVPAKRVIIVGLGQVADFNLDRVRQAAAIVGAQGARSRLHIDRNCSARRGHRADRCGRRGAGCGRRRAAGPIRMARASQRPARTRPGRVVNRGGIRPEQARCDRKRRHSR